MDFSRWLQASYSASAVLVLVLESTTGKADRAMGSDSIRSLVGLIIEVESIAIEYEYEYRCTEYELH